MQRCVFCYMEELRVDFILAWRERVYYVITGWKKLYGEEVLLVDKEDTVVEGEDEHTSMTLILGTRKI